MLDRNDVNTLQGVRVRTASGEKIGRISHVYLDDQTGEPEWVTVRTGLFRPRESFIPLTSARCDGDDLVVDVTKDQVDSAPRRDEDGDSSEAQEAEMYRYYGVSRRKEQIELGRALPVAGPVMSRPWLWWIGAASAAANAALHAYLAPMHLEEEPYIGVLFILGAVLLAVAVAGLLHPGRRTLAWWVGAMVSAGMCAGYVASRTVGLPNGYHEGWDDPFGTACLLLEGAYLAAFTAVIVDFLNARHGPHASRLAGPMGSAGH